MEPHVARHRISRNPSGEVHFTGRFDADGEPIMRAAPERFLPGAVLIPIDEADRQYLIGLDAIRPLTSDERTLYDAGLQTEFPPSLLQPSNADRQGGR